MKDIFNTAGAAAGNAGRLIPADIVLFSLYQHFPLDNEKLHTLCGLLQSLNPAVMIAVEGPATQPAKQFLALCPPIDLFIRGEAEPVIIELVHIKEQGQPLDNERIRLFLEKIHGGIFLRAGRVLLRTRNKEMSIQMPHSLILCVL